MVVGYSEVEVENDIQDINEEFNSDTINFTPSEEHLDKNALDT